MRLPITTFGTNYFKNVYLETEVNGGWEGIKEKKEGKENEG